MDTSDILRKALKSITRLSMRITSNATRTRNVLSAVKRDPRAMTIKELREQIAYKREAGQISRREQVKLFHKTAYPFATVCRCDARGTDRYPFSAEQDFLQAWSSHFFSLSSTGHSPLQHLKGSVKMVNSTHFSPVGGANFLYAIVGSVLIWRTPK